MIKYFVGLSLFAGLLLTACSKSTIVGSEILGDDFVDVSFSDTFSINALNVDGDSSRVFPLNQSLYILGSLDDPVFGRSSSELYIQVRKLFDISGLENIELDSVILNISINENGFWGDSSAVQDIEVYELGESLSDYDTIFTDQQFSKGSLLGTKSLNPIRHDTSTVIFNGDTINLSNILSIPLDNSFGEKMLSDTLALQNDTLIQDVTHGLVIRSTTNSSAVFGMSSSVSLDAYTNKVVLYYTQNDSIKKKHSLTLGGKRGYYIEHDRSGSLLEQYVGNEMGSDSLLFLSGMNNNNIQLEIPYLDGLEEVLINYAEFEFFIKTESVIIGTEPIEQIYAYNLNDDGSRSYIDDLNFSLLNSTFLYYDGSIEEVIMEDGSIMEKYNLNITNELKKRIDEADISTKMRLIPRISLERANRTVLYGPEHSEYPAKLKITYTKK